MPPCSSTKPARQRLETLFEREVTRLMDRLYGTALRLTRNPDEAEDVVAETVARAWRNLDNLRDPDRLDAWLFHILNNTFVSAWRRKQVRERVETSTDGWHEEMDEDEDFSLFEQLHQPFLLWWQTPEDTLINDLLREHLEQALDALPDVFRVVVLLVDVQGYGYQEVADLLNVPLGTVRSRLSRGRSLLQKLLWRCAQEAGIGTPRTADGGSTGAPE